MTGVLLSKTNQMRLPLLLDNYDKRSTIDYNNRFLGCLQLRSAPLACNLFAVILSKVNIVVTGSTLCCLTKIVRQLSVDRQMSGRCQTVIRFVIY